MVNFRTSVVYREPLVNSFNNSITIDAEEDLGNKDDGTGMINEAMPAEQNEPDSPEKPATSLNDLYDLDLDLDFNDNLGAISIPQG